MTQGVADAQRVQRALRGHPGAVADLVLLLSPTIQVRVSRVLLARPLGTTPRNLREEVEDLTQDVWELLFRNDARILRRWDAAKGLSIQNFVGLVAQRYAAQVLCTRRHNPWFHEPVSAETVERALQFVPSPDRAIEARQVWRLAMAATAEGLTDRGQRMLAYMFRDGLDNAAIIAHTAMSPGAVHKWRSRLTQSLRNHLHAVMDEELP